jgi:hypothetical protein
MVVLRDERTRIGKAILNRPASREAVSLLREYLGEAILVISGQRRMMYQNLEPKIGGSNLC